MYCIVEEKNIQGAQVILTHRNGISYKSVIILFHRILYSKEDELTVSYSFAKQGHFVISMDMYGQGFYARNQDSFRKYEFNNLISDICQTADKAREIISCVEFLSEYNLTDKKIGVAGISIGATLAMRCIYSKMDISYAICFIGTCDLESIINNHTLDSFKYYACSKGVIDYDKAKDSLGELDFPKKVNQMNAIPIFFADGKFDTTIPSDRKKQFYENMGHEYKKYSEMQLLYFKSYSRTGHEVTSEMIDDSIDWIKKVPLIT